MSENKKYTYSSPMINGVLPDIDSESSKLLFPYITIPPIKKNNSCSYHLKKLIECIQSKESNCDDLIHNFITCLDYKK